jgi:superfamily II DNA/RNA helicase
MNLPSFHPAVARWFVQTFQTPTAPQAEAWPAIRAGRHTLIAAPTGSGKTLAAFLAAIDELVRQGIAGQLTDETQVVYVSPLKALSKHRTWHVALQHPQTAEGARLRTSTSACWCAPAIRRRRSAPQCANGRPISW